jgi:hypothetical protein
MHDADPVCAFSGSRAGSSVLGVGPVSVSGPRPWKDEGRGRYDFPRIPRPGQRPDTESGTRGTRYRAPLHHPHTSNLNKALHLSFGATLCQLFLRKGRWAEKYRIDGNILRHGNCLRGCGIVGDFRGAPGGTRTPDPEIRNLVLYPTELQAPRLYPSAPMLCSHRRVS